MFTQIQFQKISLEQKMLRQENYYQVHLIQSHKVEEVVEEFCQICCLKYEKTKKQAFRPALTCYQCWYMHVKTHVQKISYNVGSSIISPFQSQDQIDVCIALNGLNKQHKEELQQFLFKKYTTFTKDIGKCPSQSCDFVYMASKCKWNANHECPKCLTPLAMTQNFTLKSVLGFIYFIFLANKCPKCQIPIERISGCPHMTCPCGHEFCWFCLKDHSENLNNLNTVHEPKQCASIFFSKIIILMTCLLSLSCFLVGGETLRWLMDGMFNILGYLIHCLIVDLFFSAQWVVVDMYRNQPYKRLPFQGSSKIVKIQILVLINVIFIGVLCLLDLFYVTVGILLVELGLVGFGSGVVYAVFYSCETWFQFIN